MMDHTLKFADEATAHSVLDPLGYGSSPTWDQSRIIPNQAVITADAVWDNSDPQNPVLVSSEQTVPGYYITIALDHLDSTLQSLPNNACRFIANRDAGGPAAQCIVYVAPDVEPAILAGSRVRTVFAGSNYVFPI